MSMGAERRVLEGMFRECEPDPGKRLELVGQCRTELRAIARKYSYLVFIIAQLDDLESMQ